VSSASQDNRKPFKLWQKEQGALLICRRMAPASARVAAANAILDRGHGRPEQSISVGDDPLSELRELPDERLNAQLVDLLKGRGAIPIMLVQHPGVMGQAALTDQRDPSEKWAGDL
jgi:hypothetical protein